MIYNSERCSSDDVAVAVVIMWAHSWDSNAARSFFKGEAKGLNPLLFPICLPPQSCFKSQINEKKKKINPSSAEISSLVWESSLI